MVKVEMSGSDPGKVKVSGTSIDINQVISKVRELAEKVKQPSIGGQAFAISVDGFSFSIGKAKKTYKTRLSLDVGITRKGKKAKA
jgi:hypothetical protein